jgi:hypothetical protein
MTSQERIRDLRAKLAALRARHDSGAVSAGTYATVRELEIEISWHEHRAANESKEDWR